MRKCSLCGLEIEDFEVCPKCGALTYEIDATVNSEIKYDPLSLLKNLVFRMFDYKGVISRKEFWLTRLYVELPILIMYYATYYGFGLYTDDPFSDVYVIPQLIINLNVMCLLVAYAIASISLTVRRLHDIGRPGPLLLIMFIPIGGLVIFFMCMNASKVQDNKWRENDIQKGRPVFTPDKNYI